MSATYLVSGASGQLGRRVVSNLLERGIAPARIIATTRKPESLAALAERGVVVRAADFDDETSLTKAFAGATRALLVSTDALDAPGKRIAQHRAAIRALEAAKVDHVVYTSVPNPYPGSPVAIGQDHLETEQELGRTRLGFTILRNSLYIDLLLHALPAALASGDLVDARGDGAAAFVTREDCALAAAAALASDTRGRRIMDVTGPAALTSADVAKLVSDVAKKPIRHVSLSKDALVAGLTAHGFPPAIADVYASFDVAIEKGDFHVVSSTVKELTGNAPESVAAFLGRHASAITG